MKEFGMETSSFGNCDNHSRHCRELAGLVSRQKAQGNALETLGVDR